MPFVFNFKTTLEDLPLKLEKIQGILERYPFSNEITMHIDIVEEDTTPDVVWVKAK